MELVLLSLMAVAVAFKLLQERLPHVVYRALLVAGVTAPLVATGYAMWRLPREWIGWRELTLFFVLYLATGLGTTVGFHRLLTHRSFETRASVKLVLLALGSMANQGRCIDWAAHHLKHHAHSDRDGDPHSPLHGFFHAHVGWIFRGDPAERERYCKRLLGDPVVRFVDRTSPIWVVAGLAIPFLVAGWTGLLWGGLVRIAFTNQVAFAVNSICHTFGSRPFATKDESRNNWLVAVVTLGEGWHNNHHAFPSMAFHGMKRGQPDVSALVIQALVRLHLAWGVRQPSWASVERRVRKLELARE
jgi:stearoyl-CoA desaturase (Delta-9 desaturase)